LLLLYTNCTTFYCRKLNSEISSPLVIYTTAFLEQGLFLMREIEARV